MKLKEQLRVLAFMLALPLTFAACDSDEPEIGGATIVAEKGVFVFNSGNQGAAIDGALSFIDAKTSVATNGIFKSINGRSMGSTVQDGVVLGDKMYIAVHESNTIEVVNKNTLKSLSQIKPTKEQGSGPRDVVTDGKYIYVSMFSGHVLRIDPAADAIDKSVKVGPNPEEMAIANNALYVVNSDGMNWGAGYANGKSVSKITLATLDEKKIAVGLNPTKVVADASGNVIVLCMGDYDANPAMLCQINNKDEVANWNISATMMAVKGNSLYIIEAAWGAPAEAVTYAVYNTQTGAKEKDKFVTTPVAAPVALAVDPNNGRIFISSYNLVGGKASASTPGYVNEYLADGTLVKKFDVGVGPTFMTFLN